MKAEVIHYYAYDIGGELTTEGLTELFGRKLTPLAIEPYRRSPPGFFFYHPLATDIEPLAGTSPAGPLSMRVSVRLAEVGAMSIMVRLDAEFERIPELMAYYDIQAGGKRLDDAIRELATRVLDAVRPHLILPADKLVEPETYTAFCLGCDVLGGDTASSWLQKNRRDIVALLAEERNAGRFSEQEINESIQYQYSYFDNDAVVIDWDAALVIDAPPAYEELLYLFELGNMQLEELTEYDRILDAALDQAYDDLAPRVRPPARSRRRMIGELREIRVDLARMTDELSNTTKFFGDWHIARIYEGLARRFHLNDWTQSVSHKLRTLEGMYNMLQQERNNRWMLILETTIVGLFLLDLATLLWWAK